MTTRVCKYHPAETYEKPPSTGCFRCWKLFTWKASGRVIDDPVTKLRRDRRARGQCASCSEPSATYRCARCQDIERTKQQQRRALSS